LDFFLVVEDLITIYVKNYEISWYAIYVLTF